MMQFTISPDKAAALLTCLRPMTGVGQAIDGETLTVEVYPPYGAEREDQVRQLVLGVDPAAVALS